MNRSIAIALVAAAGLALALAAPTAQVLYGQQSFLVLVALVAVVLAVLAIPFRR